jgi:hypothetical protein
MFWWLVLVEWHRGRALQPTFARGEILPSCHGGFVVIGGQVLLSA